MAVKPDKGAVAAISVNPAMQRVSKSTMALSSVYLVALCFLGLAVLAAESPYRQQRQMTRPGQDIPLPDRELLQRQIALQNERYNRPLDQQPFSDNDVGDHQFARRNDYYCRLHPSHTLTRRLY